MVSSRSPQGGPLDRVAISSEPTVAVIGAGLSGLTCARALSERGCRVLVFEKSRGPGGRASTRRYGTLRYDHGAQYLTVSDGRFAERVAEWERGGIVAPWTGRIVKLQSNGTLTEKSEIRRYVGVPGMSALARALSEELAISWKTQIKEIRGASDAGWRLSIGNVEAGEFDAVVTSAPPVQSATLLRAAAPELARRCEAPDLLPCWAVMLAVARPLPVDFDGAFIAGGPLAWVARDSSKPGRSESPETWVLHAGPEWSREYLESDPEDVIAALTEHFFDAVGLSPIQPEHVTAHRWRYARARAPGSEGCLVDEQAGLAVCGDWLHGDRIEGAFLSGLAAAQRLAAALG